MTVIWISELIRIQANQLVFIAQSYYQLNGREGKPYKLTTMFYGFCRNTKAIRLHQTFTLRKGQGLDNVIPFDLQNHCRKHSEEP
jgi:hypothetical protein